MRTLPSYSRASSVRFAGYEISYETSPDAENGRSVRSGPEIDIVRRDPVRVVLSENVTGRFAPVALTCTAVAVCIGTNRTSPTTFTRSFVAPASRTLLSFVTVAALATSVASRAQVGPINRKAN